MLPRDANLNGRVFSALFSIIQYDVFSDIKDLNDQVFSDRQLAYGMVVGTTCRPSTFPCKNCGTL